MRRLIYTHRRVSFQQSPRDSARVSRGLEPVCNKINRGVARERTRGAGMGGWSGGGRKDRERESEGEAVIEPPRGWFSSASALKPS